MHPAKHHSEGMRKYIEFESSYDFSSLPYPVPSKDINPFCMELVVAKMTKTLIAKMKMIWKLLRLWKLKKQQSKMIPMLNEWKQEGTIYPLKVSKEIIKKRHG